MVILSLKTGLRLLAKKQHQDLYNLSLSALQANPKDPLAFFFIGHIAEDTGALNKAVELYDKASALAPDNARYLAYSARAHLHMGQRTIAKTRADQAAKTDTNDALVCDILGRVYSQCGFHELALPHYEKAVFLNPKWPAFWFNLAAAYQFLGQIDASKTAYLRAIELDEAFAQAWYGLVGLSRQSRNDHDQYLPRLKSLFYASKTVEQKLIFGHTIAKILEDIGEFEQSFKWLSRAKADKQQSLAIGPRDIEVEFTPFHTLPRGKVKDVGTLARRLIFVVGLPRTGTTLLTRILSSHSHIKSAGEVNLFAEFLQRELAHHGANGGAILDAAHRYHVGQAYLSQLAHLDDGKTWIIDKTPINFKYIGWIHNIFPEAKILVLRRGAMDSCLSNYRQVFASQNPQFHYTYDLENTGRYFIGFYHLMARFKDHLPNTALQEIVYEELVKIPKPVIQSLLAFLGLEWQEACLNFKNNPAAVDTASSVQVRQALHQNAVGRYLKYGDCLAPLKAVLEAGGIPLFYPDTKGNAPGGV